MSKCFGRTSVFVIILSAIILLNKMKASIAQMGRDHNMPSDNLGDRKALLIFKSEPSQLISGKNVGFNFA